MQFFQNMVVQLGTLDIQNSGFKKETPSLGINHRVELSDAKGTEKLVKGATILSLLPKARPCF